MKTGILFDLDGTLWDSAGGVARAWNRVLERRGRPERLTTDRVHALMGRTGAEIARILFPGEAPEKAEEILHACMEEENAWLAEHGGTLYPGLEETLQALREQGFFLAIVSNCQAGYIEAFLKAHRLADRFDDQENYGRTGLGKAENIRLVVERNALDRAYYLGDTIFDYEAAGAAGVPFIHAAYGFGTVPEGTPAIRDIRDLPGWLRSRQEDLVSESGHSF